MLNLKNPNFKIQLNQCEPNIEQLNSVSPSGPVSKECIVLGCVEYDTKVKTISLSQWSYNKTL